MNSASCALLLSVLCLSFKIADSQFFYDNVKMYGCRCLQKDRTNQFLNSLTGSLPINANKPIWETVQKAPTIASNLHSKIQYLKQWLATLTLDTPTVPPPTTTHKPVTVDPVALPYDEGTGNSVFLRLAYNIMSKYFKKFGGEWTILDRFECVCDGNLIDLLKSKTFINIQIAHD